MLYFLIAFSWVNFCLYAQEKKDVAPTSNEVEPKAEAKSPSDNPTELASQVQNEKEKSPPDLASAPSVSSSTAEPSVDEASLLKAMDQALKETLLTEAKAYYPMINTVSVISTKESVVFEVSYDQPSEKDVLKIQTDLYPDQFLEKLLEDYNYLATRE